VRPQCACRAGCQRACSRWGARARRRRAWGEGGQVGTAGRPPWSRTARCRRRAAGPTRADGRADVGADADAGGQRHVQDEPLGAAGRPAGPAAARHQQGARPASDPVALMASCRVLLGVPPDLRRPVTNRTPACACMPALLHACCHGSHTCGNTAPSAARSAMPAGPHQTTVNQASIAHDIWQVSPACLAVLP